MDIGDRLREERERLSLSQAALGEVGGVRKLAQINYEKGLRSPDTVYLAAIARIGVDVGYVITGHRGAVAPSLTADEMVLLQHYRDAPAQVRNSALAVLLSGGHAPSVPMPSKRVKQVFHGQVGQYVDAPQEGTTIHMGGSKRKK